MVEFAGTCRKIGIETRVENKNEYIQHLLGYVDLQDLAPLKIVVNNGNGSAAPVVDLLEQELPFTFIKAFHEPDGTFQTVFPILCFQKIGKRLHGWYASMVPILESPGMVISTVVSSGMRREILLKAIILWDFWPLSCSIKVLELRFSMIHVLSGIQRSW